MNPKHQELVKTLQAAANRASSAQDDATIDSILRWLLPVLYEHLEAIEKEKV